MNVATRMMLPGLLIGALILLGSCVRGIGVGTQPGQGAPPDQTPAPVVTPAPAVTPAPSATPAAEQGDPGEVEISWDSTVFNRELVQGFHIHRGDSMEGPFEQVSDELIDIDSGEDGILQFVDRGVFMNRTYFYRIQIVTRVGDRVFYRDPIEITVNRPRGLTEP